MKVTAIIASHNRRELTSAAITDLFAFAPNFWSLDCILVDDGSSDGTADAVRALAESVTVIEADGSLYWAKAMALAESAVNADSELLLWMNDDVRLRADSLLRFHKAHLEEPEAIIVGQLEDPDSLRQSYGGVVRLGRHPFRFEMVEAVEKPLSVHTFHGNMVLIPKPVRDAVGTIDAQYEHAYADFDYGLRALQAGIQIIVLEGFVGSCRDNKSRPFPQGGPVQRVRESLSRKSNPLNSQIRFARKHGRWEWPLYVLVPHIRAFLGIGNYS